MRRGSTHAAPPLPFAAKAAPRDVHLRLLHLTDLHAHLYPWDYGRDRAAPGIGLGAAADLVARARADAPNAMLFDGGDCLQGAALGDLAAQDADADLARGAAIGLHPMIAAMNLMGFDAGTFGNHDFNFGLDLALAAADHARFPIVLANLFAPGGGALLPPWTMLTRDVIDAGGRTQQVRIGVVGFCPPQIVMWDARHLKGRAEAEDIVPSARRMLPQMRAAGCDLIVALCHSGITPGPARDGMENAALQLAALGLADVVLTGHQHLTLPGPDFAGIDGVDAKAGALAGVPSVMPAQHGEGLGVVDLMLTRTADGPWRVRHSHVQVLRPDAPRTNAGFAEAPAPRLTPGQLSRAVLDAGAAAHARTQQAARRAVGQLAAPLQSWFALIADSPAVRVVNMAQHAWAARHLPGDVPLLSAAAPFRAGWRAGPGAYLDVPVGPVARRHVDMLYPFPNQIRVLHITGACLKAWLERSAAIWHIIAPGAADAPLINPAFAPYNFDVIDGVAWEVDLTRPPLFTPVGEPCGAGAGRIRNLTWNSAPVRPEQRFAIVTNGYRAGGGGRFSGLAEAERVDLPDITVGDAILEMLRAAPGGVDPTPAHAWRFRANPGATAVLQSAPGAPDGPAAALASGGRRLQRLGLDADGFAQFRLHL